MLQSRDYGRARARLSCEFISFDEYLGGYLQPPGSRARSRIEIGQELTRTV